MSICVERSKGGKSVILSDEETTRNPNSEQISKEGIVHGTLNEQIENFIGNYQENIQEKESRHTPVQGGKNAADPAETIETIYNKIVYFKHHNMFTPSQGTTTEMMTREMTRIITMREVPQRLVSPSEETPLKKKKKKKIR